jgi:hypothetical protein
VRTKTPGRPPGTYAADLGEQPSQLRELSLVERGEVPAAQDLDRRCADALSLAFGQLIVSGSPIRTRTETRRWYPGMRWHRRLIPAQRGEGAVEQLELVPVREERLPKSEVDVAPVVEPDRIERANRIGHSPRTDFGPARPKDAPE